MKKEFWYGVHLKMVDAIVNYIRKRFLEDAMLYIRPCEFMLTLELV